MWIIEVAQALEKQSVDYAVVGGFAVALHGAIRGTLDLDVVVEISRQSFIKTEKALKSIGLQPRLPLDPEELYEFRKEYIEKRNLVAWSFYDAKDPTHVVDVIITTDLKKIKTVKLNIHRKTLFVASIPSLIDMKKKSGRPQDIEDIKALEKIMERK